MIPRPIRYGMLAALFLWAGAGDVPAAGPTATPEDFLQVLAAAPWPLQILAYCHAEVAPDPSLRDIGRRWNERNGGLLATIEERAAAAGIPEDVRRQADEASLAGIVALAARQSDKAAWCATIARVVDSGAYDIDQRTDLRELLKRILGIE